LQTVCSFVGKTIHRIVFSPSKLPNRSARTDAGSSLAKIAARTFGVVVALAVAGGLGPLAHHRQLIEPMADNGSIVQMDQLGRTPFRISLRTGLAMKNAERRGSM